MEDYICISQSQNVDILTLLGDKIYFKMYLIITEKQ